MIRRRPSSPDSPPPAPPLDDEDLLREILLRLPPQPSSLPRASLVCTRWRRLVSDPRFLRRFRAHHRKPPLLGVFSRRDHVKFSFTPTPDPPDRIPDARFSLPQSLERWLFLGCRHGLALLLNRTRLEAVVWDPMTGDQRLVAFLPGFDRGKGTDVRSGAVLCASGDADHVHGDCRLSPFKLVLVGFKYSYAGPRAFAFLYESGTGVWGNLISTATANMIRIATPSILVGNALCWLLTTGGILEFDLDTQSLAVIERPADAHVSAVSSGFQILRTEGSRLGLAILTGVSMEIWEKKANFDGVLRWVLQKTVQLDKLLSLGSVAIRGFAEDTNVIFLSTDIGGFMVQVKSMQFKSLSTINPYVTYYPYNNFYTAERRSIKGQNNLLAYSPP